MIVFYNSLDRPQFVRAEPKVPRKRNRVEPEFCALIVAIHVDMRRFVRLMAEKIERIWPNPESCRHFGILRTSNQGSKHSFVRTTKLRHAGPTTQDQDFETRANRRCLERVVRRAGLAGRGNEIEEY